MILFEALSETKTKVESYGLGYGDSPEYDALMEFFIKANEGLLVKLIECVEKP